MLYAGLTLLCGSAVVVSSRATALAAGPTVTAITPNNGPGAGGTSITISGDGFLAGSSARVGDSPATDVRVNSPTSITARSPAAEGSAGEGTADVRVTGASGESVAVPADQFAYNAAPSEPWLGLNGNSLTYLGPVGAFAEHGVVYDRIGWTAGETIAQGGGATEGGEHAEGRRALAADITAGMIPVIPIEYRGYDGDYSSDPDFPTEAGGSKTLGEYVAGFIRTASAILSAYPGRRILFEPMNEPWGYTTPQYEGAQYANVIARLLPAARLAHIPLSSIYVAAYGRHWVSQMYRAQPALEREVQGWYFHPYGPPSGSFTQNSEGIQSVPHVQAEMTSGQNNIIVSEVGFCALDVNSGRNCGGPYVAHGYQAAERLSEALANAVPYHDAGWLRALLVYSRNDGGWAMQLPGGELTDQGEVMEEFADAQRRPAYTLEFARFGVNRPGSNPFEEPPGFAWIVRSAARHPAPARGVTAR
jgi:IPT/TIG domain